MRFDNIIIGAGHSGLEKGMELLAKGESVLAVAKGESSRRFKDESYDHFAERKRFTEAGGVLLFGDSVVGGEFADGRLECVFTSNHGSTRFEADNFWIATGSFFSGGLKSESDRIWEPVFNLDLNCSGDHTAWVNPDFFADQPFMHFGVETDSEGRPSIEGRIISNLYSLGSIKGR